MFPSWVQMFPKWSPIFWQRLPLRLTHFPWSVFLSLGFFSLKMHHLNCQITERRFSFDFLPGNLLIQSICWRDSLSHKFTYCMYFFLIRNFVSFLFNKMCYIGRQFWQEYSFLSVYNRFHSFSFFLCHIFLVCPVHILLIFL